MVDGGTLEIHPADNPHNCIDIKELFKATRTLARRWYWASVAADNWALAIHRPDRSDGCS